MCVSDCLSVPSFFLCRIRLRTTHFNARLMTLVVKADNDFILSVLYYCLHWSVIRLLKVIKLLIFSNN